MSDLPPVCDFCDLPIDEEEDETLNPVHIGAPAIAKEFRIQGFEPVKRHDTFDRSAQGRALINAMKESKYIDINLSRGVQEVTGGEVFHAINNKVAANPDITYDDSKVAAEATIRPKTINNSPDLEVCDFCADRLRS